jgi:hypothetical protein
MRTLRAAALAAFLVLLLPATAFAQVSVDPTVTPALNTGGWVRGMAILLAILGLIVILLVVVAYVRFAPRFSTDETAFKVVRADRVRPGEELPRRTVDMKAAVPVVVAPPSLPERAGVAAAPAAPAAPAAAPAAAAPVPVPSRRPRRYRRPLPRARARRPTRTPTRRHVRRRSPRRRRPPRRPPHRLPPSTPR